MSEFSHFDAEGKAHMVDVSAKDESERLATAGATVTMAPETLELVLAGDIGKGDVLGVARLAGIMGAKRTSDLIPLCHPLPITSVKLDLKLNDERACVDIESRVRVTGRTGVEMEALTAVNAGLLTIYDMCKAVDRGMTITDIQLLEKSGGRSGDWKRQT